MEINISVVIPTCNRKERLLSLLKDLDRSYYPLLEIIIVDSGEDRLCAGDYEALHNLNIIYIGSEQSVCIQRNKGIAIAKSSWIFVCDDDIEVPADYIKKLVAHIEKHNDAIAVSGLVLQQEKNKWTSEYPIRSTKELLWKYIFKLSIWGRIDCKKNYVSKWLKKYYTAKGNHISKAGWPVITDFTGDYVTVPVYGLGASLIKKNWLLNFPYDEVLDRHGIGDNYGLAINFPPQSIHILNEAFVYHYQETANRLQKPIQYYNRSIALDYFRKINKKISFVKKGWLLWSLFGNLLTFILAGDGNMMKVSLKLIYTIGIGENRYYSAYKTSQKG
jgi:glycosyltransferase involved in cell wall biosynthesis